MRGKASFYFPEVESFGITPAYAGKRELDKAINYINEDHPRLCGEKDTVSSRSNGVEGSPPPMRGKVFGFEIFSPVIRITPAYAGKSVAGVAVMALGQDHPRLCGEKLLFSPQEM